jgi:hypothetical protein
MGTVDGKAAAQGEAVLSDRTRWVSKMFEVAAGTVLRVGGGTGPGRSPTTCPARALWP